MKVRKQVKTRNNNFSLSENQNANNSVSPFNTGFNLDSSNSRINTYHNRGNDSDVLVDIKNESLISDSEVQRNSIINHNGSIVGELLSRRQESQEKVFLRPRS